MEDDLAQLERESYKSSLEEIENYIKLVSEKQTSVTSKRHFDYEHDLEKMMHSFGDAANPDKDSIHALEIVAQCFVNNLLNKVMEDVLQKHKEGKTSKKILKQPVDLEQLTQPLSSNKRARAKEVVSFMRKSRRITKTRSQVEEDNFDEEEVLEDMCNETSKKEEEKVAVEPIWNSISVIGEASEKGKLAKLERLKYRSHFTEKMTAEQYQYFAECTKVSFVRPQRRVKFMQWAKLATYPIQLSAECVDVLGQLVYEHVEEVVRGALLHTKDEAITPEHIKKYIQLKLQANHNG